MRAGLDTDHRAFLLSHAVHFSEADWHEHHARQFAKVLSPLGVELGDEGLAFPLSEEDHAQAVQVLARAGVTPAFAVFHIAASKAPRAWHARRFGNLGQELEARLGVRAVLVGAPADAAVHREFVEVCPGAVDLAGQTSLRGMGAVIAKAALFVGNDSGPMHVAAAVGAQVVALFGPERPTRPRPTFPPDRYRVVYADLPCSPCRQAFWQECSPSPEGKPPCLEGVSVGAVLHACEEMLNR